MLVNKYKKLYGGESTFKIDARGKVDLPPWLIYLILHKSGLKSRKKRHIRKRLKKEFQKMLVQQLKEVKELVE